MKYNILMTRRGAANTGCSRLLGGLFGSVVEHGAASKGGCSQYWLPHVIVAMSLIAAGATVDPKDRFTARQRSYWAFQPVRRPETPAVKHQAWVRNPIDALILAKLEAQDLSPSPEADRITLIRRVSFDLIGLPPSEPEVAAFLSDRT